MKINELRVNNWYNSVKFNLPVRCELSDLYELCARSDGAYNDPPIDEMFEPIPLTEEWLLKLRFCKIKYDIRYWRYGSLKIKYNKSRFQFRYKESLLYIKYDHQLQNLYYALTGEELTIKL